MSDDLRIRDDLVIPEAEISWATSPSSGPGGQNVNKVETRVTLRFDLASSPSLQEEHKERIRERLAGRINKAGVLRVTSQKHRTQAANRQAARERFAELLAEALEPRAPRKRTRVPGAAKRRRVQAKRRRGEIKRQRGSVPPERE